jgi:hypothetical protein
MGSHPSADKIDDAKYLIRVHASISDGQNAAARLPSDRTRDGATSGRCLSAAMAAPDDPTSIIQKVRETDIEEGFCEQH